MATTTLRFCTQCGEKRKTPTIKFCVACGWKYPAGGAKKKSGQSYGTDYLDPEPDPRPLRVRSPSGQICKICNKTLYAVDKISIDDEGYHVVCFKCVVCRVRLTTGKFRRTATGFKCIKHFNEEKQGHADLAAKRQIEIDDEIRQRQESAPAVHTLAGKDIGPTVVGEDEDKPKQRKRTKFKPKKTRRKEYDVSKEVEKAKAKAEQEEKMKQAQDCGLCGKTALPRESLVFNNTMYHNVCFKCVTCGNRLSAALTKVHETKFYCEKDYGEVTRAKLDVSQDQPDAKAGEKYKPNEAKIRRGDQAKAVATDTGSQKIGGTRCATCKKMSYPAESVLFEGTIFHATCLRCGTCDVKLVAATCHEHNAGYYCDKHFEEITAA